MRIIIIGDTHIEEKVIPELSGIFTEILKIKADKFIQLGDFFEHNRPTPLELKFATSIVKKLKKKFKDVTIISGTGTHDLLHDTSVIEFLKELGVNAVKGDYIDKSTYLYSHFMLYESQLQYGTGRCGIKDLAKYGKVFLGHQHTFQELSPGIYHPGSIRYIGFNELTDPFKRIIILNDGKVQFKRLSSPYPMIQVRSVKELPNVKAGKVKCRLVISSFDQFKKEVNEIGKWRHKFNVFKVKYNFSNTTIAKPEKRVKQSKKLKELLLEGIKKVEDKDVQKLLKEVIE